MTTPNLYELFLEEINAGSANLTQSGSVPEATRRQSPNYRQLSRAPFIEQLHAIAEAEQSNGPYGAPPPEASVVPASFRGRFGPLRLIPSPPVTGPSDPSRTAGPILEFFRKALSGSGNGRGRARDEEDDNYCYARYGKETGRCIDRYDDYHHQDFLAGCLERARVRWDLCNRNGGVPSPREPSEWNQRDEEAWRNFSR